MYSMCIRKMMFVFKLFIIPDETTVIIAVKAWFPLSQLQPRLQPISSQNKAIGVKETAQPYNCFVFVSWSWRLPCNGNQALSQLRPRQRPISSQDKAISVKDDCSTL